MTTTIPDGIAPLTSDMDPAVFEAVFSLFRDVFGPESEIRRRRTYEWEYEKGSVGQGSRLLVCWRNGRPVGTAGILPTTLYVDGTPYEGVFLCDLSASPDVRGEGIGGKLVEASQNAEGVITVGLGVSPSAWPVLLKKGFVEVRGVFPAFRIFDLEAFARRRLPSLVTSKKGALLRRLLSMTDLVYPRLAPIILRVWTRATTGRPFFGQNQTPVHVRPVDGFPPEINTFTRALPQKWAITWAPDHVELNKKYVTHPYHGYRIEIAYRGTDIVGFATWRVLEEPFGLKMGNLTGLTVFPNDFDALDALVLSGLEWLRWQGTYAVRTLVSSPFYATALRRHLFFRHGGSPGLFYFTRDARLEARLNTHWLVHFGISDVDVP